MYWINIGFGNDDSVEFQLHLNDYFPNIDLNIEDDFFMERSVDKSIRESNDYQAVLFENNICENRLEDNSIDSYVKNVYSEYEQSNLLKYNFSIDKKLKGEIMNDNSSTIYQISDLKDSGVDVLSYKPLKKPKIIISPNKCISLVSRQCPYCEYVGGYFHDYYPKQIRNKNGMKEKYRVELCKCPNCDKTYGPYTYKRINNIIKRKN